jgi:hypothetical protein
MSKQFATRNEGFSRTVAARGNAPPGFSVHQATILGFAHSEDSEVAYLSPFRHPTRLVCAARLHDEQVELTTMRDLIHDGNKLFSALRGYPSNTPLELSSLEDIGTQYEQVSEESSTNKEHEEFHFAREGSFSCFVGAGWVKRESEVSSARVLLAVTSNVSADQWRFVVLRAAELFGEPAVIPDTPQACVLKFIDAARAAGLNVNAGDLILPIVQTKRVVTAEGVIFVG